MLLALLASWILPLPGAPVIDRGFQPPATAYGPGHRGVDLRGALGEPVLAAGAGRVSYAGLLAGRGVVVVEHVGGLRTTYEPVSASVHVGQAVLLGQVIGHLTAGHASCRVQTVCLHWGLLRGPTYLDPLSLLRPTSVRLLPLGTVRVLAPVPGPSPAPVPALHAAQDPAPETPVVPVTLGVGLAATGVVGVRRWRRR